MHGQQNIKKKNRNLRLRGASKVTFSIPWRRIEKGEERKSKTCHADEQFIIKYGCHLELAVQYQFAFETLCCYFGFITFISLQTVGLRIRTAVDVGKIQFS